MKFIQEFGYTVKVGQEQAHQKWVTENDERLRKGAPPGWKYIGTFTAVYSTEKHAGGYRLLMELDSYGALDAGAANDQPVLPSRCTTSVMLSANCFTMRRSFSLSIPVRSAMEFIWPGAAPPGRSRRLPRPGQGAP